MKKIQKNALLTSSALLVGMISLSAVALCKSILFNAVRASLFTLLINKDNPLVGGNVKTSGGTNIHFDEYGVDETIDDGAFELAPYGSVCLQSYINGISAVEATSVGEGSFYLTVGATPNSAEYTTGSFQSHARIDLMSDYGSGCYYFSIHNNSGDSPITIQSVSVEYSCSDPEAALKALVDSHLGTPQYVTYDGQPFNPYEGYEIDEHDIPENRKLVKTMSEDEYPIAPGRYTYGYGVYDVDNNGNIRKLLYLMTKDFQIISTDMATPNSVKVITFHIPDEHGKEKVICQKYTGEEANKPYDLANLPSECYPYLWSSPYNDFSSGGDHHYYPVFRVTGLSGEKEGDGCYPVHLTYSYLEKGFKMPNPEPKPGYQFLGWYLDPELTEPFDELEMHPGNLTLYAKCVETDLNIKRVYYHYADGTLANRIDCLTSDDAQLELPEASTFMDVAPATSERDLWSIFAGNTNMGLYLQRNTAMHPEEPLKGDKIKYSDFSNKVGDVHAYFATIKKIPRIGWSYDLFSEDEEGNNVFQHTLMSDKFTRNNDFSIPGYSVEERESGYHIQADAKPVDRTGHFFMTDEKVASLYDGGTLKTIASYGYGNIEMRKPLSGILRHESVQKVGRRAFFNRYGVKGTYFPRNATEFEIEAYSNVTFDRILALPKNLTRIGDRCFMGSENITFVCLPKTIKYIGPNAFAYGTYNSELRVYENITNRTTPGYNQIAFVYEGSEHDFNALSDSTKAAITNNGTIVAYNYSYETYYGRG